MMPREEEGDGEEEGAGGDGSDDSEVDEPPVGEAWEGTELISTFLFNSLGVSWVGDCLLDQNQIL